MHYLLAPPLSQNEEGLGAGDGAQLNPVESADSTTAWYNSKSLAISGSEEFVRNVTGYLDNIASDSAGALALKELIDYWEMIDSILYIRENQTDSLYIHNGPNAGIWLQNSSFNLDDGLGDIPAYVALAHEIGHAHASAFGNQVPKPRSYEKIYGSTPAWERQSLDLENKIRAHNNYPIREHYWQPHMMDAVFAK